MYPMAGVSAGTQLNRMLDALGLPDKLGDLMGASLDMKMGDMAGAQRNLYDAYSGMKTKTLDRLQFGGALPPFGALMPPFQAMSQALSLFGLGSGLGMNPLSMAGGLGMSPFGPGGFSPGGMPFGGGMGLPGFGMFGGPGTGALLLGNFMSRLSNGITGALGGALTGLAFGGGGGAAAGGLLGGVTGFLTGGTGMNPMGFGAGNYAGNNLSSIINNPSLSIEDKMALALMTLAARKEKEVEQKLREMSQNQGGGGPFGGLGQMFGVGGQQKSEQILSQELQMIQQKMQRLLETLSNVMKSFHDTSMASINNIR